jgi:formylglycine-generating enzyme required for sulfatase activity
LSAAQRQPLVEKLLLVYENEPDAGLHGAAEWLLRKWGQAKRLEVLVEKLQGDDKQLQVRKLNDKRKWYINTEKQTFVIVDAGEFVMGSPESEPDRCTNESQHRRRIGRRFAIATTGVTKEQFGRLQTALPEIAKRNTSQWVKTDDSPQVEMTWYEAAAYCNWLSEKEGIPKEQWCYEPNDKGQYAAGMKAKENHLKLTGYRLPTEAEWEYACRAGTVTSRYYGLTDSLLPQFGWYQANGQNHTERVGSLKPNDLGLFDMLGNTWEWCFDMYSKQADKVAYEDMPTTQSVDDRGRRVLRGGAFAYRPSSVRSAYRGSYQPDARSDSIGFRPARTYP